MKQLSYSTVDSLAMAQVYLSVSDYCTALQWLYCALQCARRPAELAYSPIAARAQRAHIMVAIQAILPLAVEQGMTSLTYQFAYPITHTRSYDAAQYL